jgi:hypothetical protein
LRVFKWIGIGFVIIVLLGVCGALLGDSGDDEASTPAAPDAPNAADPVAPPPPALVDPGPPPPPAAPVVLLDLSGSGTKTTQKFTARGDWDLEWSYDCSSFGQAGNFQVFADGPGFLAPVNQLDIRGTGVEHYHDGGEYYLTVNSVCNKWTVKAVDVP